nr:ABC transporter ATP-binding protein [uncultured Flavobacterium sp.]
MNLHQKRVEEVKSFFYNNDINLGFRKLLDCVTDTQNMIIYKKAIELTDFKESNPSKIEEFVKKANDLLLEVNQINVSETNVSIPVLKAVEISKSYGNSKFALGPVSVEIRKRQVYGLVGENGNGKTTLLRILAKEISFNQGSLNFSFNSELKNDYDLRTRLIYIPQRTERWYGSLKDNLKFVLANYGAKPEEIETRVLLMIARLGLWKYKHLQWNELSSGYKMRFELARTLLRKPEILLLDEPLANLDVLAQQVILEDLKAIANSVNNPIALILSSQQLFEVEKMSDKVIFLKNGRYKENLEQDVTEASDLIIELDTKVSREQLQEVFANLKLQKIIYNGGIYVIYFHNSTDFHEVIFELGKSQIPLTYIRNISASTRRFFMN